jgi:hypothetical protein
MTTLTRERSRSATGMRRRPRRGGTATLRTGALAEGQKTLEAAVMDAFDGLVTAGSAACPVCRSDRLTPSGCSSCGSQLS